MSHDEHYEHDVGVISLFIPQRYDNEYLTVQQKMIILDDNTMMGALCAPLARFRPYQRVEMPCLRFLTVENRCFP